MVVVEHGKLKHSILQLSQRERERPSSLLQSHCLNKIVSYHKLTTMILLSKLGRSQCAKLLREVLP